MWGLENDLFEDDYNIEAHQVSETLVKSWFPEAYKNRGTSPDHRDILNALESVVEANDAYTGSPNGRWEHVVQYLRSWL